MKSAVVFVLLVTSVAFAEEARDLLKGVDYPALYKIGLDRQTEEIVSERPVLSPIKPQLREKLEQLVPLAYLESRIAEGLGKKFTKQELKEMTAFFSTPTGRKVAREMPVLMSEIYDSEEERVHKILPSFIIDTLMQSKEKKPAKPAK